jgi:hypothetical protein
MDTKALDVYIKNNGVCPIDAQPRDEYRTGLGYFVEGWDEHEHQAAAELEQLKASRDGWKNTAETAYKRVMELSAERDEMRAALDKIESDTDDINIQMIATAVLDKYPAQVKEEEK